MTMSSSGIPYSPTAMSRIFLVISSRRSGSSGISSSSLGRAITAAPCRLTIGRIASIRSRSPVIELTSALPWYAASPASSASTTEESMHSGRSVSSWTIVTAFASSSASSASGTPMLTSSIVAPPATCCSTSTAMRDRSPRRSCSAKILRPVGLSRSPMRQNGWSTPMTTSRVADRRTVCWISGTIGSDPHGGAASGEQFLGLADGGRGVRGVAVGPHGVGVLLGDRRAARPSRSPGRAGPPSAAR